MNTFNKDLQVVKIFTGPITKLQIQIHFIARASSNRSLCAAASASFVWVNQLLSRSLNPPKTSADSNFTEKNEKKSPYSNLGSLFHDHCLGDFAQFLAKSGRVSRKPML
jgi:hypothetical protein